MDRRRVYGGPNVPVKLQDSTVTVGNLGPNNPGYVRLGGSNLDAFGRLRVGEPHTVFDSQLQYSAMPIYWETVTANSGTATHLPNESSVRMRVTGASGSSVIRQTKRYFRYQPGKSQKITMTFVLGAPSTATRRRVGYFDARNGIYLEQDENGLYFCRRTYVSGAAVDSRTAQASWNIDKMDGTGPSGVVFDQTKAQILLIDLEWLGVGSVRIGFVVDGQVYYCHQMNHANSLDTVYMTTANLPLRYEIANTGTDSGTSDLKQICAEVSSEGGLQERSQVFATSNGATLRTVSTTYLPVLAIRPATVFPAGGSLLNRATIIPLLVDIFSEDAGLHYRILHNPTVTGGSWTNYNTTHSGVQVNATGTSVTGGTIIGNGYVPVANNRTGSASIALDSEWFLSLDVAGTTADVLAVAAVRIGTQDTDTGVCITWKELY